MLNFKYHKYENNPEYAENQLKIIFYKNFTLTAFQTLETNRPDPPCSFQ